MKIYRRKFNHPYIFYYKFCLSITIPSQNVCQHEIKVQERTFRYIYIGNSCYGSKI